jgi:hypothetical protein
MMLVAPVRIELIFVRKLLLDKLLLRARTVYTAFQTGIETAPEYLANDPDLLDEIAVISGRVSLMQKRTHPSKSPEPRVPTPPRSVASSSSHGGSLIDLADLVPDVDMGFFVPQQMTLMDSMTIADLNRTTPLSTDSTYMTYIQPMMDAAQQPNLLSFPRQNQNPHSGGSGNPNEVWDRFMEQLTRDGYQDTDMPDC